MSIEGDNDIIDYESDENEDTIISNFKYGATKRMS